MNKRIQQKFASLKNEGRGGFISFITAGDPDYDTSLQILQGLPAAGADIIELGMPFSDPMADGPAIQAASQRALKVGMSLRKTLQMVRAFRDGDKETPIVLMGYYNPLYCYGIEAFCQDAAAAGADGLIIVDLPPEEDHELRDPASAAGLDMIRLATPTSDTERLVRILDGAGGFLYYVSVMGITGTKSATASVLEAAIRKLRAATDLPIAIGFGIKTPEQVVEAASLADAAVVGSAIVNKIAETLDQNGRPHEQAATHVLDFVRQLNTDLRHGSEAA